MVSSIAKSARPGRARPTGFGNFSAVLPASPLSYDGVLIKVRWAVRVRASFSDWGQLTSEAVFQLGHVARVVA